MVCLRGACRVWSTDAGWSSPVARWAHNPEVAGSNPAPATTRGLKYQGSSAAALGSLIICPSFVMQNPEAPLVVGRSTGVPESGIRQPCSAPSLPADKRSQEQPSESGP